MRRESKDFAPCHVGIDLLGSDIPPSDLLHAVLAHANTLPPSVRLTLLGTGSLFGKERPPTDQILYHEVQEMITMEDDPLTAIRRKKASSLCVGIQLLKEKHLHAFISAGNTGALMACACIELPNTLQIKRPALMTLLPTRTGEVAVLDVGANTSYEADHLVQFAAMGVAYQKSRGVALPRVGLLNIGSEAKKGTVELQRAYARLTEVSQKNSFHFTGNIEGRDVFDGKIDVLVTDGFTGNVFLKTAEGIAGIILEELKHVCAEGCSPHLKGVLEQLGHRLNYSEYPGAILCGVDGIVIKCHGNSSPQSLVHSIPAASRLVQHGFLDQVKSQLLLI